MTTFRVLATSPLHPDAEAFLRERCTYLVAPDIEPDTLRRAVGDVDALIVRVKLPDDIFDHAPRLKACIRHGVGLDFVPVKAATRAGVIVGNLPDANTQAVVEHAVGCALLLAKDFHALAQEFRAQGWTARDRHPSLELAGRTVGIVGCGRIGRGVARALKQAFGMRVLGYNRSPATTGDDIEPATLDQLLREADIVVLTLALAPETRSLMNAQRLAAMKPGAFLINVARGELIDDAALVAALESGHLAGVALDVFDREPLPPDHPLLAAPRLFLTPHTAGGTRESLRRMSMEAARDAIDVLQGNPPSHLINAELWPGYIERMRSGGTNNAAV
ncbi:D-3-phosphoglycerate dehydrogenase [Ancylobacter aquaticus]|uniref:D-3-phosphoglycerate dehydrogenase n=1 Tax=Ancylobacter aquaticus TaxID=100 RepID=A0A4R1I012_ANCAQ|nr:hydroxyacid dehydrogenase [Ancylobacter aquaticus]TCK28028.1 D-3-phosphoglycerate dehydrogenase [Ancylobacter aquaticus]